MTAPDYTVAVLADQPMTPSGRIDAWRGELTQILPKIGATFGTSAAIAVLGIISGAIAARALGPSSRGELALLLLWPQLLCTLGNLGVDSAATYLAARPSNKRALPSTLFAIGGVQSIVLVAFYVVAVLSFGTAHALAMVPLIPAYLAGAYALAALSGQLRFRAFNAVRIAMPVLYTTLIVALAYAGSLTAMSAALAFLVAHIAADALAVVLLLDGSRLRSPDRALAGTALSYGLRAYVGKLTPAGLGVDTVVVALVLSAHDVGLFVAATAMMMAPRMLAASMTLVVFPQVSAAHQTGRSGRLPATFAMYVAACLGMAAVLVVGAEPLARLIFGEEFAEAAQIVRLLAVASALQAIRQFPMEVLRGRGRPGVTTIAEIANWMCFLVAVPVGALAGGLTGAAVGSVIASAAALVAGACIARVRAPGVSR